MTTTGRVRSILALAVFLLGALAVGALGGALSATAIHGWYAGLRKPPLTPPDDVFGPVWTVLYLLIAVAAWMAWRTRVSSCRSGGLRMWWVQLVVNLAWTVLFFGMHAPGAALLDLAVLLVAIVLVMRPFRTIRPPAAVLMAVYFAWCCFAFYLDAGIWLLNR